MIRLGTDREVQGDRQPEFGAVWMTKCFRHHPNDGVRRVVQFDCLPQDIFASAEISLPEIVTHDHHARAARLVFRNVEISPSRGLKSEHVQEVGGNARGR